LTLTKINIFNQITFDLKSRRIIIAATESAGLVADSSQQLLFLPTNDLITTTPTQKVLVTSTWIKFVPDGSSTEMAAPLQITPAVMTNRALTTTYIVQATTESLVNLAGLHIANETLLVNYLTELIKAILVSRSSVMEPTIQQSNIITTTHNSVQKFVSVRPTLTSVMTPTHKSETMLQPTIQG